MSDLVDAAGRPIVNTPAEALERLSETYDVHRFAANFAFVSSVKMRLLRDYEHMMREAEREIERLRPLGEGDVASRWREVELYVHALHDEVRMWLFLAEHDMHAAWEALVAAQGNAHWAAGALPDFEPAQKEAEHLALIERVIFPPQRFFSPGMIIDEGTVECSICHAFAGQCDHLAGEIYDGEQAVRIIHHILDLREVSLVEKPANKHARATSYSGMDLLTGESVKTVQRRQKRTSKRHRR
jgi:hypothetical protein